MANAPATCATFKLFNLSHLVSLEFKTSMHYVHLRILGQSVWCWKQRNYFECPTNKCVEVYMMMHANILNLLIFQLSADIAIIYD